jgi:2-polyprenyl-3-methyl-5-hydroxy-6-metoxy-1,4-benzoquinol methylase
MSKDAAFNTTDAAYIDNCPIGCKATMEPTDIILQEGPLLKCSECGQLISQCTEDVYFNSMQGFNTAKGTLPAGKDIKRSLKLHHRRLMKINKLCGLPPRQTRLLDIGCSSGAFLASAKALGFMETGVEPAVEPATAAMKSGLNVKHGFLHDLRLAGNYYDVVTMFEVIEHIKEPLKLLKECRRILKAGGLVVIGTGNTDSWTVHFMKEKWDYFDMSHGGHISFFNPKSVQKMAECSGFKVISIATRRVSVYPRNQTSRLRYGASKIIAELLSLPAKIFNKGHDALFFLKKQ